MRYSIIAKPGQKDGFMDLFAECNGTCRYLLSSKYNPSVYKSFCRGVSINSLFRLKRRNYTPRLSKTVCRLLQMLKYIEREEGIELFNKKNRHSKRRREVSIGIEPS